MFSRKPEPQGQPPAGAPEGNQQVSQPMPTPTQAAPQYQQAQSPQQGTPAPAQQQQPLAQPTNQQKSAIPTTARTTQMAPTIIGPDFKITGHAISNGAVQVDGEIEGDIECSVLTVGESAKVTGNVIAQEITVQGKVMGSIRGANVTLQSTSHIEGDVYHQQLAIEQGAFFEGKSRRSENPVAEAPKSEARPASASSASTGTFGSTTSTSAAASSATSGTPTPDLTAKSNGSATAS